MDNIKGFFRDKISLFICSFSLFLLIGLYFTFFQKKTLQFFPYSKNIQPYYYNDLIDGGKSIITKTLKTDTSVMMSFILRVGLIRPYVGIGFVDNEHKVYDISLYNRIEIEISGKGIKPVFVYLILKDSSTNIEGEILGIRHLCKYIEISPERKSYKLAIREFKIPDWWFDKYNLSPASINASNWNQLLNVEIATGLTPPHNEEQSIQINSIIFYRNNALVIIFMIAFQLLIISLMMWLYFIRIRPKKQIRSVTINYHAVTLEQKQKTKNNYLDYINENFHNSDLSLHLVSEQTGINQRKIAESIYEQFSCNVKTYINQIRIKEAQRLLKETDLNISEIAYKVGFSSPNNFNRVFKNLTGKIPSEFLQNKD